MSRMTQGGFHARIDDEEDTDLFRGEILGLTGGADFYGCCRPEELRREFRKSLDVFLEVCREKGDRAAQAVLRQVQPAHLTAAA